MAIADDAMNAASAHANPFWIAYAYYGCGRAFTAVDPPRALDTFREGLAYTRQHRLPLFEAVIARKPPGSKPFTVTSTRPSHLLHLEHRLVPPSR